MIEGKKTIKTFEEKDYLYTITIERARHFQQKLKYRHYLETKYKIILEIGREDKDDGFYGDRTINLSAKKENRIFTITDNVKEEFIWGNYNLKFESFKEFKDFLKKVFEIKVNGYKAIFNQEKQYLNKLVELCQQKESKK